MIDSNIHSDLPHWNYFRLLERDLEDAFRYVQPCEAHFSVYSDHFAQIILMACTEIENCLAAFAHEVNYTPIPRNIGQFHNCITSKFPRFGETKMLLSRYSLSVTPWSNWSADTPPDWWKMGYNKIKHDRIGHPDAASLRRAIEAVGALGGLLYHYYRVKFGPQSLMPAELAPHLFQLDESHAGEQPAGIFQYWVLPGER
jgi:hypothetical protein